jgi:adenosine deaminase
MNANLEQTVRGLNLTQDDVIQLARNSFEASFVNDEQRQKWIENLERTVQSGKALGA